MLQNGCFSLEIAILSFYACKIFLLRQSTALLQSFIIKPEKTAVENYRGQSYRLILIRILKKLSVIISKFLYHFNILSQNLEPFLTCFHHHKIFIMNSETLKTVAKYGLGAMLVTAGIAHLTFARKEFQAQVPQWVPLEKDDTVAYSGYAEIALGTAVLVSPKKYRSLVGKIAGLFFTAVFPGNIAQYQNRRNSFGLNTDAKRFARLFMQPLLVLWAVKATEK